MSLASVILVGPMGSGKTAVGRALADREHLDHVDIDEMIVDLRADSAEHALFGYDDDWSEWPEWYAFLA